MLKVLIADDEKGICRLLQYLIDWKSYGMEIIKTVHTGMDAIKCIEEDHPDIVITDVCMPGYSGIDIIKRIKTKDPEIHFIIISGYREFEYARDALKYGADDYLLKPIKKEELAAALGRIINERIEKLQNKSSHEVLKQYVQDTTRKLREDFAVHLLKGDIDPSWLSFSYCQEKLHRDFSKDGFLCVSVKADVPGEKISYEERRDFFYKKGALILEQLAQEREIVCCSGIYGDILLAVFNFRQADLSETDAVLHRFIFNIRELMKQQSLHLQVTVGKGELVGQMSQLSRSMQHCAVALWERIVKNSDGIVEYQNYMDSFELAPYQSYKKKLLKVLESFDIFEACLILDEISQKAGNDGKLSGFGYYTLSKELASTIFLGIDIQFSKEKLGKEKEILSFRLENSNSCQELFDSLKEYIQTVFKKLEQKKEKISRKPIREAKEYIAQHFREEDMDLETVSSAVGFNASYFSRIFKEETGKKFIEYLTDMRMQESQKLLTETDLPVSKIAEIVGYRDDKYFSRAFKKYSGLKPKEYRKLYFM
ncbi:MAG: response regulator transcription factor [Ruminococcus sp.]|jgi:two-component system response regulator YesN